MDSRYIISGLDLFLCVIDETAICQREIRESRDKCIQNISGLNLNVRHYNTYTLYGRAVYESNYFHLQNEDRRRYVSTRLALCRLTVGTFPQAFFHVFHVTRGAARKRKKNTSGERKKTISRSRKRCFANCKISQPYVRRNVLESAPPEATDIVNFYPRDLRFRLRPVMAPNCKKSRTQSRTPSTQSERRPRTGMCGRL